MALPVPQNMNVDSSSKSAAEGGDIVGASRMWDFSGPQINKTDWTTIAIAGAAVAVVYLLLKKGKL